MSYFHRILLLSVVPALFLATPVYGGGAGLLAKENGVLENTQVALLLLSGLVFAVKSFSFDRNFRFIPWMGAWLSPSIILRELDVERLAVPQWAVWVGSGMGRNLIMGIGWIVLCILAIKSYSVLKGNFGKIARSRMAILMFAAGTMLLLGSLFDHMSIMGEHGKLWEEACETLGYFLLLPAAVLSKSILPVFPATHMAARGGAEPGPTSP